MKEKHLPIGTVVMLKKAKRCLMIIGYATMDVLNPNKIFDYISVAYPTGLLADDKILFDASDIERVVFEGYKNEEYDIFQKKLEDFYKNNTEKEAIEKMKKRYKIKE